MLKSHRFLQLCLLVLFSNPARAVTLTSGQTDYTTTSDITTSASGIITSLSGTSGSLNKIKNLHTITTGNSGATSSAYGIRSSGDYYQITNDASGIILTTGSSGRGISVSDNSIVNNLGSISTQGSTSYGIYLGGDSNTTTNSGSISTIGSTSYGIYLNGSNSSATNSGNLATRVYGIYSNGDNNQISNSGSITTTSGSSAHGIYVSAGSASTATSSNYSTVTNSGTISANANGIYAKDNYTQITNSGTIASCDYGIRTEGSNSTITNSGSLSSIYNSGAGTVINNSGNLTGNVTIGSGTLNVLGGTISGAVDGSSNTGSVNINSNFNQSAAFTDLNNLNINSGHTLTSSASISANLVALSSGSSLTISNGGSVEAVIQGAGTLNISGTDFAPSGLIGTSGNALTNLNIGADASLASSNDIYANNILVNGTLNFYGADNLTISGNVAGNGSGTINVASNSQNILGNFTLNSGDSLATSLGNNTAGNLTVSGAANIDADAKLVVTPTINQGYVANGTEFTLVSGNSSSTINQISDANISVNGTASNIYGLLKFTTQASADSLVLTVNRLASDEVTSNKNSQNIYQNLNDIGAGSNGKLSDFQGYLDSSGLTGDALSKALNQAAPQSSKANLGVTSNIASNSILASETRLGKLRQRLSNGAWVQSFGSASSQNDVKSDDGYKANSLGLVIGADQELGSDATIGVALSFARSNVKSLDSLKQNLISSNQLSFYSGQNFGKYFLDSLVGFAWNSYSSNRALTALDAAATARYSGQTYLAKIKTGRNFKLKHGLIFTPEASLNILHNSIGGYSEEGADELNLKVSAVSASFLEARLGANLGWETRFSDFPEFKKVTSVLKFSYGHALVNTAPTTKASFEGQASSFNSQISHLDSNSLRLGTEITAFHENFTSFSFDYNFEKRATYASHFIAAKIRQEF